MSTNGKIPLFKIHWDDEDIECVGNAIRQGMNWAAGPNVDLFEKRISEKLGVRHAVVFNSGTSALHAVLAAYDITHRDEVIIPTFTFIATANAPQFVGATPVFCDIEEDTFGLDPTKLENTITDNTKVIIAVHYGGCPCQLDAIREIANRRKLILIEDAAGAFGAEMRGKKIGGHGDSAIFSFCQNKIITTGEGGCVTTHSTCIADKLKRFRSHGENVADGLPMEYISLGFNFRMSNITAALGISQLKKMEANIVRRKQIAAYLTDRLRRIDGITMPTVLANHENIFQMFPITTATHRRDALMHYLNGCGVATKVYFRPVHLSQYYRNRFGYKEGDFPVAESIAQRVISLPIYPTLEEREMAFICDVINDFFNNQ